MNIEKQETVVFYCIEDIERVELETMVVCINLALSSPALVVDRVKANIAKEIRDKMEKRLNDS